MAKQRKNKLIQKSKKAKLAYELKQLGGMVRFHCDILKNIGRRSQSILGKFYAEPELKAKLDAEDQQQIKDFMEDFEASSKIMLAAVSAFNTLKASDYTQDDILGYGASQDIAGWLERNQKLSMDFSALVAMLHHKRYGDDMEDAVAEPVVESEEEMTV